MRVVPLAAPRARESPQTRGFVVVKVTGAAFPAETQSGGLSEVDSVHAETEVGHETSQMSDVVSADVIMGKVFRAKLNAAAFVSSTVFCFFLGEGGGRFEFYRPAAGP